MKLGALIKLYESTRRCGKDAGKTGVIVAYDRHGQYDVLIEGKITAYHSTQIVEVL